MAIVVHIKTRIPYEYIGDNKFKNLNTGAIGYVPDDLARKVFVLSPESTYLCNKYPAIKSLIGAVKLRIEKP